MKNRVLVAAATVSLVVGTVLVGGPASGSVSPRATASEPVVSTVLSRPGLDWTAADATNGSSVLTYGNIGCTTVDSDGFCEGGTWPTIPAAHWIWRSQNVTEPEASGGTPWVTFVDTFSVTHASATGKVAVVADDEYSLSVNGSELGTGTLAEGVKTFAFTPLVGENTLSVTARSLAGPADPFASPAGVSYAVTLTWQPPPPRLSPVVTGTGEQYWPTADGDRLAWVDYHKRTGSTVWFRPEGGVRTQVNARGTFGSYPTLVPGTDTVVYQQFSGRESGVYEYDTVTGRSSPLRGSIASRRWEYGPVASSSYVLFMRCRLDRDGECGDRSLMLLDRGDGRVRVLVADTGRHIVFPGFAGDRYLAWTDCTRRAGCEIRYLDTTTGRVRTQYRPPRTDRYAPAIDEATGTIYFAQYGWARRACADTSVRRSTLGSRSSAVVWDWPRGVDAGWNLSLTTRADGRQDLVLERWDCVRETGDIYRLSGVGYAAVVVPRQAALAGARAPSRGASALAHREMPVLGESAARR